MSWFADRRLDFIDWRLATHGEVRREHLMTTFGISQQQASMDIQAFLADHSGAMTYDKNRKLYAPAHNPYRPRRNIQRDRQGRLIFII